MHQWCTRLKLSLVWERGERSSSQQSHGWSHVQIEINIARKSLNDIWGGFL